MRQRTCQVTRSSASVAQCCGGFDTMQRTLLCSLQLSRIGYHARLNFADRSLRVAVGAISSDTLDTFSNPAHAHKCVRARSLFAES